MALLPALLHDAIRLGLWLVLLAVVFVPLERLFALHPAKVWRRDIGVDIGLYFLNSLLPAFVLSVPLAALAVGVQTVLPGDVLAAVGALPFWLRLAIAFVVGEVGFYWGHRWTHEVPFLWQFHAVHHAPEHIDWMVNTRTHPVDMVFTRLCGLVPIYVLGLAGSMQAGGDPVVPALVAVVGTLWGFFIHSNLRWRFGVLEWVVATPAFHHWHHVLAGPINRNYASMLPWLDRVFRTHHLPSGAWPEGYGVSSGSSADQGRGMEGR